MLDFRKQEQGFMTIKVSEQNIVDFIYENYLIFQEYALQRKINFKFNKSQDYILMWYDAKQMQKVMNNLISNAFKHTKEGGEISVSIRKGHKEIIIEVTDNGIGISSKDIEKIFDRFYQTDQIESISDTGTGIGLSLTKGIIELHHGTIKVFSEPGEGTTFGVYLKTGKEHFLPEQISETQNIMQSNVEDNQQSIKLLLEEQEFLNNENTIGINKGRNAKILIVEDNDSLRNMLTKIFTPFYTVFTASNGLEGWEKVQSEHPHIVLSDIVMPIMSGTELCKKIKENIETCHIPVVLLTARTATEYNLEGLRIGADDYITKPFSLRELLARVKANLRRINTAAEENSSSQIISCNNLSIDPERYEVTKNGEPINLTYREFELLKFLATQRGKIFSRVSLMNKVWDYEYVGDPRTVDVTVRRLREKIEDDPARPNYILTKRGVGYYFHS